jgi:hypothetical protein
LGRLAQWPAPPLLLLLLFLTLLFCVHALFVIYSFADDSLTKGPALGADLGAAFISAGVLAASNLQVCSPLASQMHLAAPLAGRHQRGAPSAGQCFCAFSSNLGRLDPASQLATSSSSSSSAAAAAMSARRRARVVQARKLSPRRRDAPQLANLANALEMRHQLASIISPPTLRAHSFGLELFE